MGRRRTNLDWTTVLVAVLAMMGTIIGSWMGVRESNKMVNFRLDALEEKVSKHNNLVERTAILERDLKTAFRLIDEAREEKV